MIEYEELLDNAEKENITVIENYDFSNTRLKGLYCNKIVALNKHYRNGAGKEMYSCRGVRASSYSNWKYFRSILGFQQKAVKSL